MVFGWLKQRRRRQLRSQLFPAEWDGYLRANFPYDRLLDSAERAKLRGDIQVFVAEKNWEGCAGLEMTDEIRVTIAAGACLLGLHLADDCFDRVLSILVYPSSYRVPERQHFEEFHIVGESFRLGEAWYRGPIVLSWSDALTESRHLGGGRNVVWHEFAHQLDMLDRSSDGTPPLETPGQYRRWADVMDAEFKRLRSAARTGQPTLIDPYGATNEAEFFAVVSECFFDRPVDLAAEHPELYGLFQTFYRQDPAARWRRGRQA